ncbi:unnamed protein product [Cyprideis torosa]|uniref:Uncharacterized protein n=1 Tax=Cyprideis torosa TaxID=163714 RepID=A0A7R8ZK72_9CRUS|nr:unnamed protein product [Cyprideis torosa]CAG0883883.1 unnamed protein product [Cyprideis torosa]
MEVPDTPLAPDISAFSTPLAPDTSAFAPHPSQSIMATLALLNLGTLMGRGLHSVVFYDRPLPKEIVQYEVVAILSDLVRVLDGPPQARRRARNLPPPDPLFDVQGYTSILLNLVKGLNKAGLLEGKKVYLDDKQQFGWNGRELELFLSMLESSLGGDPPTTAEPEEMPTTIAPSSSPTTTAVEEHLNDLIINKWLNETFDNLNHISEIPLTFHTEQDQGRKLFTTWSRDSGLLGSILTLLLRTTKTQRTAALEELRRSLDDTGGLEAFLEKILEPSLKFAASTLTHLTKNEELFGDARTIAERFLLDFSSSTPAEAFPHDRAPPEEEHWLIRALGLLQKALPQAAEVVRAFLGSSMTEVQQMRGNPTDWELCLPYRICELNSVDRHSSTRATFIAFLSLLMTWANAASSEDLLQQTRAMKHGWMRRTCPSLYPECSPAYQPSNDTELPELPKMLRRPPVETGNTKDSTTESDFLDDTKLLFESFFSAVNTEAPAADVDEAENMVEDVGIENRQGSGGGWKGVIKKQLADVWKFSFGQRRGLPSGTVEGKDPTDAAAGRRLNMEPFWLHRQGESDQLETPHVPFGYEYIPIPRE